MSNKHKQRKHIEIVKKIVVSLSVLQQSIVHLKVTLAGRRIDEPAVYGNTKVMDTREKHRL